MKWMRKLFIVCFVKNKNRPVWKVMGPHPSLSIINPVFIPSQFGVQWIELNLKKIKSLF